MIIQNWKWQILTLILAVLGTAGLYYTGRGLFSETLETVDIEVTRLGLVNEQDRVLVGRPAPEFELPYVTSRSNLYRFQGSTFPTVLVFWASWHQGSVDQLKIVSDLLATPGVAKPAIIAVNLQENRKTVEDFLIQDSVLYIQDRVLYDESGRVGELYGVRSLPTTFFIDGKGVIQGVFVGVLNKEMLEERINKLIVY